MGKIKILAIVGSLRKGSFNRQLALEVKNLIGDQAEFVLLDYQDVPFMNQDIEFPAPEPVKRVRKEVKEADAIWFFTPEYNQSCPSVLTNLIDWLSRTISKTERQVLAGKPATVSGISIGMCGTMLAQHHLNSLISYLNMNVMNNPKVAIPSAFKLIDSEGNLEFKTSAPFLMEQLNSFLKFIQK